MIKWVHPSHGCLLLLVFVPICAGEKSEKDWTSWVIVIKSIFTGISLSLAEALEQFYLRIYGEDSLKKDK